MTFIKLHRTTCNCWYNDITDIHCHCMLFWTINRYFESLIPRQHIFAPIPIQSHEWSRHLFYLPPHGHRVFFQSPEVQTTGLLSEARYQGSQNARAETKRPRFCMTENMYCIYCVELLTYVCLIGISSFS